MASTLPTNSTITGGKSYFDWVQEVSNGKFMPSTLPTNSTITGGKTYFDWVQEVSNGKFMPSILFGIFVILFMLFKTVTSNGKAFVGSAFICMVTSIFLSTLGWMAPSYMYATIILTAIGSVWAFLEDKQE
jgi:hypothetical protein